MDARSWWAISFIVFCLNVIVTIGFFPASCFSCRSREEVPARSCPAVTPLKAAVSAGNHKCISRWRDASSERTAWGLADYMTKKEKNSTMATRMYLRRLTILISSCLRVSFSSENSNNDASPEGIGRYPVIHWFINRLVTLRSMCPGNRFEAYCPI